MAVQPQFGEFIAESVGNAMDRMEQAKVQAMEMREIMAQREIEQQANQALDRYRMGMLQNDTEQLKLTAARDRVAASRALVEAERAKFANMVDQARAKLLNAEADQVGKETPAGQQQNWSTYVNAVLGLNNRLNEQMSGLSERATAAGNALTKYRQGTNARTGTQYEYFPFGPDEMPGASFYDDWGPFPSHEEKLVPFKQEHAEFKSDTTRMHKIYQDTQAELDRIRQVSESLNKALFNKLGIDTAPAPADTTGTGGAQPPPANADTSGTVNVEGIFR